MSKTKRTLASFYKLEAMNGILSAGIKTEKYARKYIREQRASRFSDCNKAVELAYISYKKSEITEQQCSEIFTNEFYKSMRQSIDFADLFLKAAFAHHPN